jgi:drug/metabolite transporter (DMT)-like permease
MSRNIFASAACFFVVFLPVAAVALCLPLFGCPTPHHVTPAPELDVGLLSLIMVGGAAGLAYWRKRNS